MKYLIVFLTSLSCFIHCQAQSKKHTPNPKAKQLDDQSVSIFMKFSDNKDSMMKVGHLLDAALKTDSNYYEGWINKISFQCHFAHFEDGLKTAKRMKHIFKNETEVDMLCAVLQYKTGNKKEAQAGFEKLLKNYDDRLKKSANAQEKKGLEFNKGIMLILTDKPYVGKALLKSIYDVEKDPMVKSNIAFYINNNKEQIIEDKVPGQ